MVFDYVNDTTRYETGAARNRAAPTIKALPRIRAEVGSDYLLFFDSGIRSDEGTMRAQKQGVDFFAVRARHEITATILGSKQSLAANFGKGRSCRLRLTLT